MAEGKKVEIFAIVGSFYGFVDVLVGEELEDEREEVCVEKKLGQVFEFQDV